MTTSSVTFSSTTSPAAGYSSKGSVTMHSRGPSDPSTEILVSTANMMMQTERAQRAATKARMTADEATQKTLTDLHRQVENLTTLVTQQGAEISALKQARTQEKLVQNVTIRELRRQVAALATDVNKLQKAIEFIKPTVRDYYITCPKFPDAAGNFLDGHGQMMKPAGLRILQKTGARCLREQSELEQFLDMDKRELWHVGYVRPAPLE